MMENENKKRMNLSGNKIEPLPKTGVVVYEKYAPPKEIGLHHRLMCLTGEKKGTSYILKSERIVIGRDEESAIFINDNSISRQHAELKRIGNDYIVTDLGSQNGVVVNDLKIKQHSLLDNDKIILGKLVFKYNKILIEKKELKDIAEDSVEKKIKKTIKTDIHLDEKNNLDQAKSKKKKIYIIITIFLMLAFLFGEEETEKTKNEKIATRDLVDDKISSYLGSKQEKQDKEIEKKLNEIFHRGLREEREGNYYRAINEFNLALIISPGNSRGEFYLKKTKMKIDLEIQKSLDNGTKLNSSLRYRAAINEYCTVLRLLQYDQENEKYKEALNNITKIEEKLGIGKGAVNCL